MRSTRFTAVDDMRSMEETWDMNACRSHRAAVIIKLDPIIALEDNKVRDTRSNFVGSVMSADGTTFKYRVSATNTLRHTHGSGYYYRE